MGGSIATIAAPVIGGLFGSSSASDAASAQENAANSASATQMAMFQQMQKNLQPYMDTGGAANNALLKALGLDNGGTGNFSPGSLLAGPQMDEATLQNTPGYQFNLTQGLKATQNSAAARGLASSGAALKGASTYATGLADSTYQNQFNNAVTNQTNTFNRLMGLTQLGQNSAAGVGAAGVQTGANIGSNIIGAGNAAGAADIAGGNAISNGISTAATLNQLQGMYSNNGNSGSGDPFTNNTWQQFLNNN